MEPRARLMGSFGWPFELEVSILGLAWAAA